MKNCSELKMVRIINHFIIPTCFKMLSSFRSSSDVKIWHYPALMQECYLYDVFLVLREQLTALMYRIRVSITKSFWKIFTFAMKWKIGGKYNCCRMAVNIFILVSVGEMGFTITQEKYIFRSLLTEFFVSGNTSCPMDYLIASIITSLQLNNWLMPQIHL